MNRILDWFDRLVDRAVDYQRDRRNTTRVTSNWWQ